MGCLTPANRSAKQLLHISLRENHGAGGGEIVRAKGSGHL